MVTNISHSSLDSNSQMQKSKHSSGLEQIWDPGEMTHTNLLLNRNGWHGKNWSAAIALLDGSRHGKSCRRRSKEMSQFSFL
ncbi:hypothetical protein M0R45_024045 [Rubus argutus]|uniref:Uncharacterized protein n=1 Tax=Rubus argutus TaxID=59490 RepID=A0AAW1WQ13_RUBAR